MFRVITFALAFALATPAFAAVTHSRNAGHESPVVVDLPAGASERDLADPAVRRAIVDQALAKAVGADVVVLVRGADGALVRPDAARQAPGGATNTLRFTFDSPDYPWTPDEVATLERWLADFLPAAIEVYGPPAFDLTVNVRKDPGAPTAWYAPAWNEIGLRQVLYQEILVCHEMIHAFHDDWVIAIAAWEEGMTSAATSAVFARLDAYFTSDERHAGQMSVYEMLNRPPLAAFGGSFGWNSRRTLRYQMSDYAWTKPLLENGGFLAGFNAVFYAASTSHAGSWTPEDELELRAMARAVQPQVEALDFDAWYDRQHVLDLREAPGDAVLYMAAANTDATSISAHYHAFLRDVNETPLGDVEVDLRVYDHAGMLAGTASARTDGGGTTILRVELPAYQGYAGRMRLVATAAMPAGDLVDESHRVFGPGFGFHGVVVGADEGEVTVVRTSDGLTATSPVVNGAFSTAALNDEKGMFVVTWRHPDGRTVTRTFTKDRAPYYVELNVDAPPLAMFQRGDDLPRPAQVAAIADLDGDGDADLATVSQGEVVVLWGDGAGGFVAAAVPLVPFDLDPKGVAAGDLDRDGHVDLVVALGTGGVLAIPGTGAGGFGPAVHHATSNCCSDRVWLRDLDRDGDLDAIVANTDDPYLSVLRGDGAGGFAPAFPLSLEGYADGAAFADFDRDGDLDVMANNSFEPRVRLFANDGAGGFAAAGDFAIASTWNATLAAGDVNGDGWPDLVIGQTTAEPGGMTTLLLNDGTGGFSRVELNPAVGRMQALADFDRDGDLDFVARGASAMTVFLGNGDASFLKEHDYAAAPVSVVVGDLDGNGSPDLVATGAPAAPFLNRTQVVGRDADTGSAFAARVTPNPSRGAATLAIVTTRAGALKATLLDLAGRRVRTLIDEPLAPAGTHAVRIGDAARRTLAPGLYFYRVEAVEGRASGRLVILE